MISPKFAVTILCSAATIAGLKTAIPDADTVFEPPNSTYDSPFTSYYPDCLAVSPGTCTLGMYLSYDSHIMVAELFDHTCELIGTLTGMTWDMPSELSSPKLPSQLTVDPHWDGQPPEFWYEGRHYQDGWTVTMLDDYSVWYEWMQFTCED